MYIFITYSVSTFLLQAQNTSKRDSSNRDWPLFASRESLSYKEKMEGRGIEQCLLQTHTYKMEVSG